MEFYQIYQLILPIVILPKKKKLFATESISIESCHATVHHKISNCFHGITYIYFLYIK